MIKHIGKHSDRKVAIIFREVPNEEHMALVIYPETLPVAMHDGIMRVIESAEGQAADNLGDALFRSLFPDGRPILETLHREGMMKKVQAKQITVTPTPSSHVNLEEMNSIIREMKTGEDALKRLAELDADTGMTGKVRPRDQFGREVGAGTNLERGAQIAGSDAALAMDDQSLALNLKAQADRMAAEARGLIAESERLLKEASALLPAQEKKSTRGRKKVAADAVAR
jgi:hypothetical protein